MPYIPSLVAILIFSATIISYIGRMGPGLLFLALGLYIFPVTAVLSVLLSGRGHRLVSLLGTCGGLLLFFVCLIPGWNPENTVGMLYLSTFAATVFGTLAGRIMSFRRSKI